MSFSVQIDHKKKDIPPGYGNLRSSNLRLWPIYSSCLYVFKTSSIRFQGVFKTSSRPLAKISSRCFQDLSSSLTVLVNKSSRSNYSKDGYLEKDLPRSHFEEIDGQCTKFVRVIKISQVLVYYFTTPFEYYTFYSRAYRGIFRIWSNIYNGLFLRKYWTTLKY